MIVIHDTCVGWLNVLLIHWMTSCKFLPRYGNGRERVGRSCCGPILFTFQVRDLFLLIIYLLSGRNIIRSHGFWNSWKLHHQQADCCFVLEYSNFLRRVWWKTYRWPERAPRMAENFWLVESKKKTYIYRPTAAYSTWMAWGGRRDGGNVQYVDSMGWTQRRRKCTVRG
jgi:hypothetical protein